jgi:putative ABC transport system permease protein
MIKNYIIIAFRNLLKSKLFSFINIAGLSIGMAGSILLLWIENQLSIDQFHKKKDYLYKAYNKAIVDGSLQCWENTPPALASSLKQDYPEIKNVARVSATEKLFGYKDKKVEVNGIYTDPAFLNMFSFPLVKGNAQTGLKDAHSIFITEQLSKKIFGEEDPVNKVILADNSDNYTITGVIKNLPDNTHFKFEYILPWGNLKIRDADNLLER